MDTRPLNAMPDSMVVYTVTEIDTQEAQSPINTKNPYRQNAVHSAVGLRKDVAEDSTATLTRTQGFYNPYRKTIANRRQQTVSAQQPGSQQRRAKRDAHCVSRRDSASSFSHDSDQSAERSNEVDTGFDKEGQTVDVEFDASQIRNKVLQLRVENELSALRNILLDFA
jgi:hypothetical protein